MEGRECEGLGKGPTVPSVPRKMFRTSGHKAKHNPLASEICNIVFCGKLEGTCVTKVDWDWRDGSVG